MHPPPQPVWLTILATCFALLAFAGNSLLCRHALDARLPQIDAATFTAVRIASGALVLALIVLLHGSHQRRFAGSWLSGAALFAYAIAFSLAYHQLSAGMGAMLLFGSVQATMIGIGIVRGERPRWLEWLGLATALGGLAYLMLRRDSSASLIGALLMASAGIAWGIYSLRGRGVSDPVATTAGNFLAATPLVLVAWLALRHDYHTTPQGLTLAAISGAITSGIGYVVWYHALPGLTAMRAALVQLAVPVITALLAAILLRERITPQLLVGGAMILGGIALSLVGRARR